ncbi:MAG TPA: 5-amino-6-(D-ribitylamino)uracil--L-tyrosine 4-hydroxyphenyl transferase CofH [Gaiellaceae bacterium]
MTARELLAAPLDDVLAEARARRASRVVTYSPKVFVPLTQLCRDVCHYCTFARPPRRGERAYLRPDEVLDIARAGAAGGCHEALFTLGDKPELRYRAARDELEGLGYETTVEYLAAMCRLVLDETGLLPHPNPGVTSVEELALLRTVSASQGLMLETSSERLSERGGPHFGSPDKLPARRLETLDAAGRLGIPFTTGILVGIGETREERLDALAAIRDAHERHGHVQEIIVQNFRAKPGTKMAVHPEPELDDVLWSAAAARILLPADVAVQVPPNLSYEEFPRLLEAGIDDWGGISPVTIDHVNPEAPWPEVDRLRAATEAAGFELAARLPVYPPYARDVERWADPAVAPRILLRSDAEGLARTDTWAAGRPDPQVTPCYKETSAPTPAARGRPQQVTPCYKVPEPSRWVGRPSAVDAVLDRVGAEKLDEDDVTTLFSARGRDFDAVCAAADRLRRETCGDTVSYVVTRNVNYTNVCYFRCGFCAFSKGRLAANLRGAPYLVPVEEIVRRAREAWDRGAVEICLQGGIHPAFTGETYLEICEAVKRELPDLHVHAFSALEVWQGAATLGIPLGEYLARLRDVGLASLPGTAAEILDDEVRRVICPDKVDTAQWLGVHETAHRVGLRSTTTIMFGSVEGPRSWARHLIALREQQRRTGGFTELVPLPFVHMEAPIFLKGRARPGPTFREAILMHAVGRLALHPWITNVQASWVKLGVDGAQAALRAGANDLGGTLMNESISRAAGAEHGQEMPPEAMEAAIRAIGREPRQRTTLYGTPPEERVRASFGAPALSEPVNPSVNDAGLRRPERLVRPGLAPAAR